MFSVKASAQARDIHINLKESCNCCCWNDRCCKDNKAIPMYVHKNGIAVPFDPQKAQDEREALKRAVSNLTHLLEENAERYQRDREEIKQKIEEHSGAKLSLDDPPILTAGLLERINIAINKIFV